MITSEIKPIIANVHHNTLLDVMEKPDAYHCCAVMSYSLADVLNKLDPENHYRVCWAENYFYAALEPFTNWKWELKKLLPLVGSDIEYTQRWMFQHCWVQCTTGEDTVIDLTAYTYAMWMKRKANAEFGWNPPTRFADFPDFGYIWGDMMTIPLDLWPWWTLSEDCTGKEGSAGKRDLRREHSGQINQIAKLSFNRSVEKLFSTSLD